MRLAYSDIVLLNRQAMPRQHRANPRRQRALTKSLDLQLLAAIVGDGARSRITRLSSSSLLPNKKKAHTMSRGIATTLVLAGS
jgi:hypothetical protein